MKKFRKKTRKNRSKLSLKRGDRTIFQDSGQTNLTEVNLGSANTAIIESPGYFCNFTDTEFNGIQDETFSYFQLMIVLGNYDQVKRCLEIGGDIRVPVELADLKILNVFDLCAIETDDSVELKRNRFLIFKELINYYKLLKTNVDIESLMDSISFLKEPIKFQGFIKLEDSIKKTQAIFFDDQKHQQYIDIDEKFAIESLTSDISRNDLLPNEGFFSFTIFFNAKFYQIEAFFSLYSFTSDKDELDKIKQYSSYELFSYAVYNSFGEFRFLIERSPDPSLFVDNVIAEFIDYDAEMLDDLLSFMDCLETNLFSSGYDFSKILKNDDDTKKFLAKYESLYKQNIFNMLLINNVFRGIDVVLDLTNSINEVGDSKLNVFQRILQGINNPSQKPDDRIRTMHKLLFFGAVMRNNILKEAQYEQLKKQVIEFANFSDESKGQKFAKLIELSDVFYQQLKSIGSDSVAKHGSGDSEIISMLNSLAKKYLADKKTFPDSDFELSIMQRENLIETQEQKFEKISLEEFSSLDYENQLYLSLNYQGFLRIIFYSEVYKYLSQNYERSSEHLEFLENCDQLVDLLPRGQDIISTRNKLRECRIADIERNIKIKEKEKKKELENQKRLLEKQKKLDKRFSQQIAEIEKYFEAKEESIKHLLIELETRIKKELFYNPNLESSDIKTDLKLIEDWLLKEQKYQQISDDSMFITQKHLDDISLKKTRINEIEILLQSIKINLEKKEHDRIEKLRSHQIGESLNSLKKIKYELVKSIAEERRIIVEESLSKELSEQIKIIEEEIQSATSKIINQSQRDIERIKSEILKTQEEIDLIKDSTEKQHSSSTEIDLKTTEEITIAQQDHLQNQEGQQVEEKITSTQDDQILELDSKPISDLQDMSFTRYVDSESQTENQNSFRSPFLYYEYYAKLGFWNDLIFNHIFKSNLDIMQFIRSNQIFNESLLMKDEFSNFPLNYAFVLSKSQFFEEFYKLHQEIHHHSKLNFDQVFFNQNVMSHKCLFNLVLFADDEENKIKKLNYVLSQLNHDQRFNFLNGEEYFLSPLANAIETNQYYLAEVMIANGADIGLNNLKSSILIHLLTKNQFDFLEYLTEKKLIDYSQISDEFYQHLRDQCCIDFPGKTIIKKQHDERFLNFITLNRDKSLNHKVVNDNQEQSQQDKIPGLRPTVRGSRGKGKNNKAKTK